MTITIEMVYFEFLKLVETFEWINAYLLITNDLY